MATKISEQEQRNAWLSIYSSALVGAATTDEDENDVLDRAQTYADDGLNDFLTTFGSAAVEFVREDEPEEETKEPAHRRRRG